MIYDVSKFEISGVQGIFMLFNNESKCGIPRKDLHFTKHCTLANNLKDLSEMLLNCDIGKHKLK